MDKSSIKLRTEQAINALWVSVQEKRHGPKFKLGSRTCNHSIEIVSRQFGSRRNGELETQPLDIFKQDVYGVLVCVHALLLGQRG